MKNYADIFQETYLNNKGHFFIMERKIGLKKSATFVPLFLKILRASGKQSQKWLRDPEDNALVAKNLNKIKCKNPHPHARIMMTIRVIPFKIIR